MPSFVQLLSTVAGVRGLFFRFVVGQGLRTASDLFDALRDVFDASLTSTEARRIASSLSRAVEAGRLLTGGTVLTQLDVPIIEGLFDIVGDRSSFTASVSITADVGVMGGQTTSVTRSVIVSTESVPTPAELLALAGGEFTFERESQYDERVDVNSISMVIEWAFRTFQ